MFQIEAPFGFAGLWDLALQPSTDTTDDQRYLEELRQRAKSGELFFIETEEAASYRLKIMVNDDLPANLADEFEASGGLFCLRLPSGQLRAASLPPDAGGSQMQVAAGDYLLSIHARREFDVAKYDQKMIELVGEADWRFRARVIKFGALGCLALVLAVVLLLIPFTRQFWWVTALLCGAPWLTYYLSMRSARYQRAEKAAMSYEQQLPTHVVVLKSASAAMAADVPGGWLREH